MIYQQLWAWVLGSSRGHNLLWRLVILAYCLRSGRCLQPAVSLASSAADLLPDVIGKGAADCQGQQVSQNGGPVRLWAPAAHHTSRRASLHPATLRSAKPGAVLPETPAAQSPQAAAVRHPAAAHKRRRSGAAESAAVLLLPRSELCEQGLQRWGCGVCSAGYAATVSA